MGRYRKLPIEVNAIQWTGSNHIDVKQHLDSGSLGWNWTSDEKIVLHTLEGSLTASKNDWLVIGIEGEVWAVKPHIFAKTYEEIK